MQTISFDVNNQPCIKSARSSHGAPPMRLESRSLILKKDHVHARIGLDFGGVIVKGRKEIRREDTHLTMTDEEQIAQPDVSEAVRALVSACDGLV